MKCKFYPLSATLLASLTLQANATTIEELSETVTEQQKQIDILTAAIEGKSSRTDTSRTTLGGYGEHHFNYNKNSDDQIDAHRFVLFINHQFSDALEFVSELEVEHGLTTKDGPGEVELEQAYVHWQLNDNQSLKIGQFLVPIGIINETHEPDTFYGTERNPVEKNIIPATWWEAGIMNSGTLSDGLAYDLGAHSGLNYAAGKDGNIRSARQKNAKATANEWAVTGRIKYTGIQGLEVAAAFNYQQDLRQSSGTEAESGFLIELHTVYQTGPFTIKALYAAWDISGSTAESTGYDEQTGFYIEPSYKINDRLGVFARVSEFDNLAGSATDTEMTQYDVGLNYWLHENVVLKADWQDQDDEAGKAADAVNLGIGWSF